MPRRPGILPSPRAQMRTMRRHAFIKFKIPSLRMPEVQDHFLRLTIAPDRRRCRKKLFPGLLPWLEPALLRWFAFPCRARTDYLSNLLPGFPVTGGPKVELLPRYLSRIPKGNVFFGWTTDPISQLAA